MWRIATSEEQNIKITYLRDNQQHTTEAIPYVEPNKWYERKALRRLEIKPEMASTIFDVVSNSPAALAGLKHGDRIIELNGNVIYNPQAVASAVDAMSNGPVTGVKSDHPAR